MKNLLQPLLTAALLAAAPLTAASGEDVEPPAATAQPQAGAVSADPKFYMARANGYADSGDYELAIADYGRALKLDPKLAEAYENRGVARHLLENFDAAIADFNAALKLDARPSVYYDRGLSRARKRQYDRAIGDFSRALALDPKMYAAAEARGLAHAMKKDYDKAIADFTLAIRLAPETAGPYVNRATSYGYTGRYYGLAVRDFSEAIRLDPDLPQAYLGRAKAYGLLGETEKAAADEAKFARLSRGY